MVVNQRVTGRASAMPAGVALGGLIGTVLTLLGAGIVGWLVDNGTIQEQGIGYGSAVVLLVSSIVGAWTAASLVRHQRLLVCMLTGGLYMLVLLAINILLFGGQFQAVGVTVLLVAGGCLAAAFLDPTGERNIKSRRHKRRNG